MQNEGVNVRDGGVEGDGCKRARPCTVRRNLGIGSDHIQDSGMLNESRAYIWHPCAMYGSKSHADSMNSEYVVGLLVLLYVLLGFWFFEMSLLKFVFSRLLLDVRSRSIL